MVDSRSSIRGASRLKPASIGVGRRRELALLICDIAVRSGFSETAFLHATFMVAIEKKGKREAFITKHT